jgi:hypothetical protein
MSLCGLPSELKDHVLWELGREALGRMMQVSKSYRKIGEPILYKHVDFRDHEGIRIKLLLVTLIDRDDLRYSIRSLKLWHDHSTQTPHGLSHETASKIQDLSERIWSQTKAITDIFNQLLRPYPNTVELKVKWLTNVLKSSPSFDAALALILCLATQITTIDIFVAAITPFSITHAVLRERNWYAPTTQGPDQPLQKLQSLRIKDNRDQDRNFGLFFLPQITKFEATYITGGLTIDFPFSLPDSPVALKSLNLSHVTFDPKLLEQAITSQRFPCLETLKVCDVGSRNAPTIPNQYWIRYDYNRLKKAMAAHLPKLHTFAWTCLFYHRSSGALKPFGDFSRFAKVSELELDYSLHIRDDEEHALQLQRLPQFPAFQDLLPTSLERLTLSALDWDTFENIFNTARPATHDSALQRIAQVASNVFVEEIDIIFNLGEGRGCITTQNTPMSKADPFVGFLQRVSDGLHAVGICFRAYYRSGYAVPDKHLLVWPGSATQ